LRDLSGVLIVDASRIFRVMLAAQLDAHCERVLDAGTVDEARKLLHDVPGIGLVLSELRLPDGDGLEVLEHVKSLPRPQPHFMLVTEEKPDRVAFRARALGATACLAKPTSFREIMRALRRATSGSYAVRAPRRRVRGEALVLGSRGDGTEPSTQLRWDVRDLSVTGAFFETRGPVKVGTELDLFLVVDGARVRVEAEVVRIQEPSWAYPGGVGVSFRALRPEARDAIHRIVHGGGPEPG